MKQTREVFPSYALLKRAIREERAEDGSLKAVTLPAPLFMEIVRAWAKAAGFDEADYLVRYPDAYKAVYNGQYPSALEHFLAHGYLQGRLMNYVPPDEQWYFNRYPDVAEAHKAGKVASADAHYRAAGASEGRAPREEVAEAAQRWQQVVHAAMPRPA